MASIFLKRFSQGKRHRDGKHRFLMRSSGCPSTPSQSIGSGNLIYVGRSPNLPPKEKSEEAQHKEMVTKLRRSVRGKQKAEARAQAKLLAAEIARDDAMLDVKRTWQDEILPRWPSMCGSARVTALCWRGLPPSLRQDIWMCFIDKTSACAGDANPHGALMCACGNLLDNAVNLALSGPPVRGQRRDSDHAEILGCACPRMRSGNCTGSTEADDGTDPTARLISDEKSDETLRAIVSMDVKRTFPQLAVLHAEGPLHDPLVWLCAAFTVRNPDVGYIQGLSYLAGIVSLTISDTIPMIRCLETVASIPSVRAFLRMDPSGMELACRTVDACLERCLPELSAHFMSLGVQPEFYANEWIITIFSKLLPLDFVVRIWDVVLQPPPPGPPYVSDSHTPHTSAHVSTFASEHVLDAFDSAAHHEVVQQRSGGGRSEHGSAAQRDGNADGVVPHRGLHSNGGAAARAMADIRADESRAPRDQQHNVHAVAGAGDGAAPRDVAPHAHGRDPTRVRYDDESAARGTEHERSASVAWSRERWVYVVVVAVVSLQEREFKRLHDFTEIMCAMKKLPETTTCEQLLARVRDVGAKVDDRAFHACRARAKTMVSASP